MPDAAVRLQCSCRRWTAEADSLDELNKQAALHDDSPWQRHVVRLDPPESWPLNDAEFRVLLHRSLSANSR